MHYKNFLLQLAHNYVKIVLLTVIKNVILLGSLDLALYSRLRIKNKINVYFLTKYPLIRSLNSIKLDVVKVVE